MKKVYFSTSIHGVRNIDLNLPQHLVDLVVKKGNKVLTEHVVEKDQDKLFKKLSENSGKDIPRRKG